MRKFVIATTLAVVLAGTANADIRFQDRGPRDRDTPIVRVLKLVKRLFTPTVNTTPSVPIPVQ
jgi:hypothetical protein